jgi:acetyl esterase
MSTTMDPSSISIEAIPLEAAAREFADATSKPPFLPDVGPEKGREIVNQTQAGPIAKPDVDDEWVKVPGGPNGDVPVRVVRPAGAAGTLPVILYIHGAGWVFGNAGTHDRRVRELAIGAHAAVVFPDYSLSPEAKYPVALEECYAVARWLAQGAAGQGLDTSRVAIAGDSVGGNLAAATTLLAKQRGDITFAAQALLYPVTDHNFDDGSYLQFADGYWLTRASMQWYWDQYISEPSQRELSTVSPLLATDEELRDLPKALVINAECDVLRDEGEAYARHLRRAGVDVTATRYAGIIHDFMMLNALADTNAAKAATAQAAAFLLVMDEQVLEVGVAVVLATPMVAVVARIGRQFARHLVGRLGPTRRRQLVEPLERVRLQPGLVVVDPDPGGDVHRADERHSLGDPRVPDRLGDIVGDPDELAPARRVERPVDGVGDHSAASFARAAPRARGGRRSTGEPGFEPGFTVLETALMSH